MGLDKFIDDALSAHNRYRSKHHASPLKKSKDLCSYAQKWADHLARSGQFQHSDCNHKGQRLGENIAMRFSSSDNDFSGQQATDQWYSEVSKYTFGVSSGPSGTGHFSQVVWRGSKEFGIGKAQARDGKWIVVASYLPAGNMLGDYKDNVLPSDGPVDIPTKKDEGGRKPMAGRGNFGDFGSRMTDSPSSGGSRVETVRTYTTRETGGSGPTTFTKTVTTETKRGPNGETITVTRQTFGGEGAAGDFDSEFSRKFKSLETKDGFGHKSSASASKPVKEQSMKEFTEDCVKAHNKKRAKHGAGPLKHNKELSALAQKWADHLAKTNTFQHSNDSYKGNQLGENIATKWSSTGDDYTGEQVVDQWYSEISKYDFKGASQSLSAGHFTQVVWKGSKEIGLGKARGQGGRVLIVANYLPAGNVIGHYQDNVAPPK